MLDIVGLYLHPPQRALVLSVDEKTSIQALDRTQPLLPLKPGQIERRSFEYKRNGTASLLAAFEVHTGHVSGECIRRNDSDTFIRFLRRLLQRYPDRELHVIVDNGSSHRSKKTRPRPCRACSSPGVGLLTATAVLASTADIHRFPSGRHFIWAAKQGGYLPDRSGVAASSVPSATIRYPAPAVPVPS
jgi:DDE superfamily endonuclease/Transposase IS116/IS110/IS902 family